VSISVGIGLRRVHITLSVHHLVPFPVDDRSTGDTHLEDLGMRGHHVDGHKAAEAPAVYAESSAVDIAQTLEILHALHLVFHLVVAKMAEGDLLKVLAAVLTATVVEDEEQIAFLCHVSFPAAAAIVPASVDVVGMRATVDVDDGRIFLVLVKANGQYHAIIEVGLAVGSLDGAAAILWHGVALPWVGSGEPAHCLLRSHVDKVDVARNSWFLIVVYDHLTAFAQ